MSEQNEKIERMKQLGVILREASRAYYAQAREVMSNYEYDALYDELEALEKETGIVLAGSPTVSVGYEVVSELPKQRHETPMLSLDKTKDIEVLRDFIGDHKTLVSWKLDGLTVVLTYRSGSLYQAVTRGNGTVGEVITANARTFINLPLQIDFPGELVIRGEAVISYPDFELLNKEIEDVDARYKNPRNLCSGSVRQLSSEVTASRRVRFFAFSLVRAEGVDFRNSRAYQLQWLQKRGFETVGFCETSAAQLDETIEWYAREVKTYEIPSDGLVATYDDIAYGESLGSTAKFPRNSFAFKWEDETAQTHLLDIEWSASRTGLINPVAVFEPVWLEGTQVSRASVHNVSIVRALKLGIGDTITVYKANMIIPQIAENLTCSDTVQIPAHCPVCGQNTRIDTSADVSVLCCDNPDCMAKKIKSLSLLVSRDALNIDGLSESTLEKLVSAGLIHSFADLFHLKESSKRMEQMEGLGEKSVAKLLESIEAARHTTLPRLLYAIGIPGIGAATARLICSALGFDPEKVKHASREELVSIDGVGPVLADSFTSYFEDPENSAGYDALLSELDIEKTVQAPLSEDDPVRTKTFVITGSLTHYANRSELKELIESRGGKVAGSVSAKTDYLINNDSQSGSSKNKKAKELGVKIITEDEFLERFT